MVTQEERPLVDDSVDVLLPLGEQKGKHFAEKFGKDEKSTFWYQDERKVVSIGREGGRRR